MSFVGAQNDTCGCVLRGRIPAGYHNCRTALKACPRANLEPNMFTRWLGEGYLAQYSRCQRARLMTILRGSLEACLHPWP
jgi:hypothetical protein